MRHLGLRAAFALSVAVALSSAPARADDGDCADFKNKILAADARGEIFLGYYKLRNQLGRLYATFCPRDPPVRLTAEQYAKVCGGPVPDDPDQRADMLQLCAVQGAYPDQPSPSDLPDMTSPATILPNGMSAASAWAGQIAKDPGYQRMCQQAAANENTCRQRQADMRTCKPSPTDSPKCATNGAVGFAGQAGAFNDCAALYQGVLGMCHAVDRSAAASPAAPRQPQSTKAAPPAPPKPNPNAPQQSSAPPAAAQPSKSAIGDSRPPPAADPDAPRKQQALSQMSPQCRGELNQLLQGADSGDQAKAATAYGSLRGQCDPSLRALAGIGGLGLPERIMTSRSQRLLDRAMAGDEGIVPGRAAAAAQAGGSSFDMGQVLDFGIALLGVMNGVAGVYSPISGGLYATRMGSIGNRPVQSTYGQGGPSAPSRGVTTYGNGLHEGTAR